MSIENELKIIPRGKIIPEEILELLETKGYELAGQLKVSRQEDTYYDDENKTLLKNGCSFRIRRKGNKAVVTYKSPIQADTEYKQREEYEVDIPEMYIGEDGTILIEDAIEVLIKNYSDINIPQNLRMVVKVINNRNKANITANDGTIIELAFDDLQIEDGNGRKFEMHDEMECETLSGNPENLNEIYQIIREHYPYVSKNELSKYARAVKEMQEQKRNMSLDEITICSMLSNIINSLEFQQLSYKGQMIHDYRVKIPENLKLNNFKDPQYLIEKISEVKGTKNYKPGKIETVEDMFLCFFSDMSYRDLEYSLVNFLNDNYYKDGTPITNRMLHSQQVMLITGLISRSKELSDSERQPLLCMTSALVHDIGHVPGAHPTEEVLGNIDGFFSHEINGRNVAERVITDNHDKIVAAIKKYGESVGEIYDENKIDEYIQLNKAQIKKSIEAHSRTNSEKRGDGTVVQLPREADKICYCVSDIVDVLKKKKQDDEIRVTFFTEEWKNKMVAEIGKGYDRDGEVRKKIDEIEKLINTNNFGEVTTNIANTIRENVTDGRTYYDVDQDTWDIINGMIKYVKDLRKAKTIDNKRDELQEAARQFVVLKFNECLLECDGNAEKAWDKTLLKVTQSNDLDILYSLKKLYDEYRDRPGELRKEYEEGGRLYAGLLKTLDNADRQIKIEPKEMFQMSDLQPCLGKQWEMAEPEIIRDTYFPKQEGLSLCLREYIGRGRKQFVVKRNRGKDGVTQVERQKYVSENGVDANLEELITQFNEEHVGFNIQLPENIPECVIETIRNNAENEQGVKLRRDRSSIITRNRRIQMPEIIEIECSDRGGIKKVKQKLDEFLDQLGISLRQVATKETKEELAMRLIEEQQTR